MLSAANVRNICVNLSWIIGTLSGIAEVLIPSLSYDISVLADCIYAQSPLDGRLLKGIGVDFSRDEKIKLVESGFSSEDGFLDKASSDFRGVINPRKADYAIKHVNNKRERTSEFWAREHKRRLGALGVSYLLDVN